MKCSDFEPLIALYVEDDLSAPERDDVERHLTQCGMCREFAADLRESQLLFKSIREDVPSDSEVLELRRRVLSEAHPPDPPGWLERLFGGMPRKVALAGIALFIVGGGAWWMTRVQVQVPVKPVVPVAMNDPPKYVEATVVVEPPAAPIAEPARRVAPRFKRPELSSEKKSQPGEQLTIKLVTDDPNIIIYWLVDSKGD